MHFAGSPGVRRATISPRTGATGSERPSRREPAAPRPARQDDGGGVEFPCGRGDPPHLPAARCAAPGAGHPAGHFGVLQQVNAAPDARDGKGLDEAAVVDVTVIGHEDTAGHSLRKPRRQTAHFRSLEPLRPERPAALRVGMPGKSAPLFFAEGDAQSAAALKAYVDTRLLVKLRGKVRVVLPPRQGEREEGAWLFHFTLGGQHSGRRPARALTHSAPLNDCNAKLPPLCQIVGSGKPDHPAPDDDHIKGASRRPVHGGQAHPAASSTDAARAARSAMTPSTGLDGLASSRTGILPAR